MSVTDVLSIQLYTLRDMPSHAAILDAVAEAGYRHVEMIGSHLENAGDVRDELDARGLKGSSSHVGMSQLREQPEAMIEACKVLGIDTLFMPAVPPEQRHMDAGGWRELGAELGRMAEVFAEAGIKLGYHNHHWELEKKDGGRDALDLLFEASGSSPLVWQADIAWLVRGGADPKALLQRHGARVAAAHVKDIAPEGENLDQDGWADVGSGTLDWVELWKACRAAGARWMVVEHDKPLDPAACARNSFNYITSMGL